MHYQMPQRAAAAQQHAAIQGWSNAQEFGRKISQGLDAAIK